MFQYALGKALSLKFQSPLRFNIEAYEDTSVRPFRGLYPGVFTERTFDLQLFNISGEVAKKSDIPLLYRMYGKGPFFILLDAVRRRLLKYVFQQRAQELYFSEYKPEYLDLGPNVYLDGFYQSPKYFNHIQDIIRKEFTLKKPPEKHIVSLGETIAGEASVGIFVRRTDFIGNPDYEFVDEAYYTRALAYIAEREKIDTVYVFSDDIEWCRDHIVFPYNTIFVGNEYAGERYTGKLFLMTKCKHFIIPNSTFAWWGAWLSYTPGKIVIAPQYWFKGSNINDVIPPEWVII